MAKQVFRQEAIALAASLVAQAKGDLTTTRAIVAESLAWLQSVDPEYRPPVTAIAPQGQKAA